MILVVVEHEAGAPDRLSNEALTMGRSLAEATGSPLHAVAWGPGAAATAGSLAVLGTGSERGAEVLAHVAARTRLPLTVNCMEVRPGEPWQVTRQRWGGSLLEEARHSCDS